MKPVPNLPEPDFVLGCHGRQLMMEPLCVDRLLDILVKEEVPQDDLSDIAGDPRAPGGPRDEPDVALLVNNDVGYHGREGSLAGDGEVVGGGRNAKAVGDAGVGKVIHLVVHYDSRGRREYLGSKTEVDRVIIES